MSIHPVKINNLPDGPGVYMFVTSNKQQTTGNEHILYIGKATSLRDRVKSYFSGDIYESRGPRIVKMLEEAEDVRCIESDSALEALILESNLIKKHQPQYNVREKDQKSFNFVIITNEEFPRVMKVRGRELAINWDESNIKYQFGPFPHGGQLNEALKIIRRIFPFRGEKDSVNPRKKRTASPLNQQIGIAPKLGKEGMSKKEYLNRIRHIKLFFEGKKSKLLAELEKDMRKLAKEEKFEKAAEIRNRIFALKHIRDVSLIKEQGTSALESGFRIEAYDIAHTSGKDSVGVMVVVFDGEPQKQDYRKFKIKSAVPGSDTGALKEVLERRLTHDEWPLPNLFVVDGGKSQINAANKVLEDCGISIPVVSVVKDARHRPKKVLGSREIPQKHESDILIANSEAHRFALSYHRNKRGKIN